MYLVVTIFNKLIKHKCYNNTNINGKTLIQSMTYNSSEKNIQTSSKSYSQQMKRVLSSKRVYVVEMTSRKNANTNKI